MEDYIVEKLPYSELVKLVEKLVAEADTNPDYNENDTTKKSYIYNRPCFETGTPAKTYTPDSYLVETDAWLVRAGLVTTNVITDNELSNYSISVDLIDGRDKSVVNTSEYSMSMLKASKTYVNGTVVGCKYTVNVGYSEFLDARVYVIYDYEAYNSAVKDYQNPKFTSNGIYLCKSEYDTFDSNENYTNYTVVKSITRGSTLKVHKLPNKFIDLLAHKDFQALKKMVEEGGSGGVIDITIPTTYAELKALRDESKLIPGCFYRITDYRCTSVQENTRAMDNRFDIIVRALSSNTLSETASADHHEGDTYFAGCNLAAWELKYCLDNDTTRFAWALPTVCQAITNLSTNYSNGSWLVRQPDADGNGPVDEYYYAWGTQADVNDGDNTNFIYSKTEVIASGDIVYDGSGDDYPTAEVGILEGKGVIYYMKDDFNNECPYDFKNIQFIRELDDGGNLALGCGVDTWCYTFGGGQCDRSIPHEDYREFINNSIGYFYVGCEENFLLPDNVFLGTNECISRNNKLGHFCDKNTFGITAHNNTLGDACSGNTFATECQNNSLGQSCNANTFGDCCVGNTFTSLCHNNTLSSCSSQNVLATACGFITLGDGCINNMLASGCNGITIEVGTFNQLYSNNELVGGGKLYRHKVEIYTMFGDDDNDISIKASFLSTKEVQLAGLSLYTEIAENYRNSRYHDGNSGARYPIIMIEVSDTAVIVGWGENEVIGSYVFTSQAIEENVTYYSITEV